MVLTVKQGDEEGVPNVVKELALLASNVQMSKPAQAEAYANDMEKILNRLGANAVKTLLESDQRNASSLLLGSRILSSCGGTASWLGDAGKYSEWLASQFVSGLIVNGTYFDRALKLGAPLRFVRTFFNLNKSVLHDNIVQLRPAQRQFALRHAILPLLMEQRPTNTASFLSSMGLKGQDFSDTALFKTKYIAQAAVQLLNNDNLLKSEMLRWLKWWGTTEFVTLSSAESQKQVTIAILAGSELLSKQQRQELLEPVVSGVSVHLESSTASVRQQGMAVAHALQGVDFGEAFKPELFDDEEAVVKADTVPNKVAQKDSDDSDSDSDSDADSDDEVSPPVFIKDLLEYLRSSKFEENRAGLAFGPALVARKAGTELAHYASELLIAAVNLTDKFNIPRFEEQRQALVAAIVAYNPSQALKAAQMFSTNNLSLPQKLSLLTALAAPVSSASGFESLPSPVHALFASKQALKLPAPKNSAFFPLVNAEPKLNPPYGELLYAQWLKTLGCLVLAAQLSDLPRMADSLWPVINRAATVNSVSVRDGAFACLCALMQRGEQPPPSLSANITKALSEQDTPISRLAVAMLL